MPPSRFLHRALLCLALVVLTGTACAQGFSTPPDPDFNGRVRVTSEHIVPGSTVGIRGQGFTPGQRVTLLRGETVLNATPYLADAEGTFTATLSIPADAATGVHPMIVRADGPDAAAIFDLKISRPIPLSGQEQFDVLDVALPRGLYQVAWSAANRAVFVTRAVGRAPVESEILKLDAATLAIRARATPPEVPATDGRGAPQVYAVYGIGVDDANGTVWVTNTRQGTVAVYRQSDLSLVKQFPAGILPHPRDVVVNETQGRAYVSTVDTTIAVFDTATLEPLPAINITSGRRGETFAGTSLALDAATGTLYTVSINTGEVAIINTASGVVDTVIALNHARSATGIAWDAQDRRILVAAQGSDNLLIVNPDTGAIEHDVPVGAGALNVIWNHAQKLAYVSNRAAGTIAVVDATGTLIANLDGGSFPNHLTTTPDGTVFAVNKSHGNDDPAADHIRRIVRR